ncbi:MAG: hypothetical protein J1F31_06295 [Erysipelotrichales bacterium]|nr:hypothetical protein [Erysipelotrichales bacterium]
MKKILMFLLIVMSSFCLFSCENIPVHDLLKDIPSYNLSVEFSDNYFFSSLISCPKSGSYKAGTILEVRSGIIYDADIYVYLNNSMIDKIDENQEWIYRFKMPDKESSLYITMDRFFGKSEYTFQYLFNWSNNIYEETDITKIRYESEDSGESSDILIDVIYTEDRDDISLFYDLLQEPLVRYNGELKKEEQQTSITYYINNYAYELTIINNNIVYWWDFSSAAYFTFKNEQYEIPNISNASMECHTFSKQLRQLGRFADVYYQDENEEWVNRGTFMQVFSFEFIEYFDNLPNYYAYIDTKDYDKIYVCSDTLFEYNNQAYEIIGNYNFSLLLI